MSQNSISMRIKPNANQLPEGPLAGVYLLEELDVEHVDNRRQKTALQKGEEIIYAHSDQLGEPFDLKINTHTKLPPHVASPPPAFSPSTNQTRWIKIRPELTEYMVICWGL